MPYELPNPDGTSTTVGFDALLTPREVAALFRVNRNTIVTWANQGKLYCVRTKSGQRRYPETCVRAYLNGDYETAAAPPSGTPDLMHLDPDDRQLQPDAQKDVAPWLARRQGR